MRTRDPFREGPHDAGQHYRLAFYGALLLLREIVPDWTLPAAYRQELAAAGIDVGPEASPGQWRRWDARLADWEKRAPDSLPLIRLRDVVGLDRMATLLIVLCALPDEDPRLGRSTLGLLHSCWDEPVDRVTARTALTRLRDCGVVHVAGAEGICSVDPQLTDLLHGRPPTGWLAAERLPAPPALILPPDLAPRIQAAATMLRSGNGRSSHRPWQPGNRPANPDPGAGHDGRARRPGGRGRAVAGDRDAGRCARRAAGAVADV